MNKMTGPTDKRPDKDTTVDGDGKPTGDAMATGNAKPDKDKKQMRLRLSPTLWRELAAWAEDDFRSINGQIEYLLTEAVRRRKKPV